MKIDDVKNVCVVGAGNMGHQIALQCALSGFKTISTDVVPAVLEKAQKFVDNYLPGRVQKGKMTEEEASAVRSRISFTTDLSDAAKDADVVIEAVLERIDLKRKIFADLDKIAPEGAILATNSSFIVSSRIADATRRPDRVCNLHFFNPALVMKLVEVVQGPHVSDETAKCMMDFCLKIDKIPVHVKKKLTTSFSTAFSVPVTRRLSGCSKWAWPHTKTSTRHVFTAPAIRWDPSACWISPVSIWPMISA